MKVKVGDKIYDGEDVPVMVILSDADKRNISNMFPECMKYCSYPSTGEWSDAQIEEWMKGKE